MRIIMLGLLSLCLIACEGGSGSEGKKKPTASVTEPPPTLLPEAPAPALSPLRAAGLRADAVGLERPPTGNSLPSALKPPVQP